MKPIVPQADPVTRGSGSSPFAALIAFLLTTIILVVIAWGSK